MVASYIHQDSHVYIYICMCIICAFTFCFKRLSERERLAFCVGLSRVRGRESSLWGWFDSLCV